MGDIGRGRPLLHIDLYGFLDWVDNYENACIETAMQQAGDNAAEAARLLGMPRKTLAAYERVASSALHRWLLMQYHAGHPAYRLGG